MGLFEKKNINGANFITIAGIWLTVFVIIMRFYGAIGTLVFSFTLLAILSDFLDGIYARKKRCVTKFGGFMDKVRDKTLIVFHLYFIGETYLVSNYVLKSAFLTTLVLLAISEFILASSSFWALKKKKNIEASNWGKWKMTTESLGLFLWLVFYDFSPFGMRATDNIPATIILIVFLAAFFLSVKSLHGYYIRYTE